MGEFMPPVAAGDQLAVANVDLAGQEYEGAIYAQGRLHNVARRELNIKGVEMARVELGITVERSDVPDEMVSWQVECPGYNPLFIDMPRGSTRFRKEQDHPDPRDPREAGEFNSLATPQVQVDTDGYPLNPMGRTGLRGRFMLDGWGANQAADTIATRINPDNGDWEALLVQRGDTGEWALPGGRVDSGETAAQTAERELREEAGVALDFSRARLIYAGYADDSRNTDNSWMETTVLHVHLNQEEAKAVQLRAGDDAAAAQWVRMEEVLAPGAHVFSAHDKYLELIAQGPSVTMAEVVTTDSERNTPSPERPTVAIVSSFRKFLGGVAIAHAVFSRAGIEVSNPPSLEPINPGVEYVRFPGDDPELPDHEIQKKVLAGILGATAVYVVCTGGYTGNLASYEIGHAVEAGMPVYFSEMPGMPLMQTAAAGRVVTPEELADMILQGTITPVEPLEP